jgi:predicted unusual protein kinase regulating ubiquinone biosynthesis (AarF/ABC1/UbiB family)
MSRHGRLERVRSELEAGELIRTSHRRTAKEHRRVDVGVRLARSLPAIGPIFALFGNYLADRTDSLPLRDCRELDRSRIEVDPTPMPGVGELLSMHLDGSLTDHFSAFDAPGRATLLHQWHDARLCDGTEVTVKFVRPEARVLVATEIELLPILEELDLDTWNVGVLIEDFVVWLDRQLDLGREVFGLDQLAAEIGAFDAFDVPAIVHELSCRDITVTHRTGGTRLGEMTAATDHPRPKLARRLCQSWLQQSLLEGACPEGPLADHVLALTNERFAITGGLVTRLDPRWRRNLIDAIIATARDDPDRVCDALLAECTALDGAADILRVRSELRQAETFRSGGWTDDFGGRRIADSLFVYWRKLGELGYRPKDHAIAFIRGFSELEGAARAMAPDTDVMAGAIDDFRLVAAAVSIREHLGPSALIGVVEELTPVIGEVLEDPDRLARRFLNSGDHGETTASRGPGSAVSWQVFVGAMAVLAAGTILGVSAIRSHPEQNWIEGAVAVGFIAAAVFIFRLVRSNTAR